VLGADPENFHARVGLGTLAERIGATDEAIWQFERAFEIHPNDSDVRQRLQKLRNGQNGTPRTKLSRAALGRVYMRSEQYDRAVVEFRSALDHLSANGDGDDRSDLQVALAEALYRAGRQRQAADVCHDVLKVLPNALKPNLILGSIYLNTDRGDEALPLLERARSLDPENRLAAELLESAPLEPRIIRLEPPAQAIVPELTPVRAQRERVPDEVEQMTPEPAPLAAPEPVVTEEAMEQPATPDETQTEVSAPTKPVVTEETMEPPRERTASPQTQSLAASAAEYQAQLDLARLLRGVDLRRSAEQYKILLRSQVMLPQVIDDLTQVVHAQPAERGMRRLLADALASAGRLHEAIEQYRQLV
ncbi:MAG: tetratricopeptide repeat protein, partial [Chloroflexi bacterium]|nr:tetratricopeptide repeat protein [Chloroflexota bacterium]